MPLSHGRYEKQAPFDAAVDPSWTRDLETIAQFRCFSAALSAAEKHSKGNQSEQLGANAAALGMIADPAFFEDWFHLCR